MLYVSPLFPSFWFIGCTWLPRIGISVLQVLHRWVQKSALTTIRVVEISCGFGDSRASRIPSEMLLWCCLWGYRKWLFPPLPPPVNLIFGTQLPFDKSMFAIFLLKKVEFNAFPVLQGILFCFSLTSESQSLLQESSLWCWWQLMSKVAVSKASETGKQ